MDPKFPRLRSECIQQLRLHWSISIEGSLWQLQAERFGVCAGRWGSWLRIRASEGVLGLRVGGCTPKSLWQQKAGPEPVDLFELCCQTQSWWLSSTKDEEEGKQGERAWGGGVEVAGDAHNRERGEKKKAKRKGNGVRRKIKGERP